ncbi:hypothetical protein IEQ34_002648 [Dendrobium chrysotoxum]|uniref:Uncharacterized protein n=1 Tax=Dendrobium chrysotoxum TaxID=161865 RepID=A0AAV7HJX0_DENCH|nr:hypothetical protein IEQ34_002648 [Dendrobium chrysotoxum]
MQLKGILHMIVEKETEITDALYVDLSKPMFESFIHEISLAKHACELALKELEHWMKSEELGSILQHRLKHLRLQKVSSEGFGAALQISSASEKMKEKKVGKTTFDIKLEKFDATAKIRVPVTLKQGIIEEEATGIVEKIKAVGGVAVIK